MHFILLGVLLRRTPVALVMKLIIIICGEISKLWRGVLHYVSLEVQEPALSFCSALLVDPKNPLFFYDFANRFVCHQHIQGFLILSLGRKKTEKTSPWNILYQTKVHP